MYGYDSAFIGGTLGLPSFQRAYGLAEATKGEKAALSSNIVSTFQAGAFFGAIIGFFTAERLGRKPVIMGSAVVFIVGVILQMIGEIGLLCMPTTLAPLCNLKIADASQMPAVASLASALVRPPL